MENLRLAQMIPELADGGKRIVHESSMLMRCFAGHYVSHLLSDPIEAGQALDLLRRAAKIYLTAVQTYNPLIMDATKFKEDISLAQRALSAA